MGAAKRYWVGFNLVKGIGPVRLQRLLDVFGDIETAWQASQAALRDAGLPPRVVQELVHVRASVDLDAHLRAISSQGIEVLTWEDRAYPGRLQEIDQSPPVVYVRGSILEEDEWAVAIVGTRRATSYGRQVAQEVAGVLARNGVTVVSGLARGVDTEAHQGALRAGGRTLAVLGSGVDRIYPPENRRLAARIIDRGALVSDYLPGTPPEAVNFPPRNRIISGLSLAVVVVEAGRKSGALITTTFAADQGREVFAVPGNITAPQSQGTNRLLQHGCRPLLDPEEVLEALDLTLFPQQREARVALPADDFEARLLALVRDEPLHVDDISTRVEMPVDRVSATLAMMELKGLVRSQGGMRYVAAR